MAAVANNSKIVLITGANKGIGWETVKLLSAKNPNYIIYLGTRTQVNGDAAIEKLPINSRKNVRTILIDVTSDSSVKAAVERIKSEQGHLDILINNSGIASFETSYESAKSTFETNIYGVKRVTDAFLPLIPSNTGHIIIVSSEVGTWSHYDAPPNLKSKLENVNATFDDIDHIAKSYLESIKSNSGLENFPSIPNSFGAYGFSKALVSTYGRILGRELYSKGIPVINETPGYCATDLNHFSGPRTAEKGAESVLQGLEHGIKDSGKLYLDDEDQGLEQEAPEWVKQASAKMSEEANATK